MRPLQMALTAAIGERNPFDEPALEFGGDPTEGSEAGNSFNHDRRGGNFAFVDGRTAWLDDARRLPVPLTAGGGSPDAWDYVYDDRAPSAEPLGPRPAGTTVPPWGTAVRMKNRGSWLVH